MRKYCSHAIPKPEFLPPTCTTGWPQDMTPYSLKSLRKWQSPPKTSLWCIYILFFQLTTNSQIYFTSGSSQWLRRNKLLQKLKKISEIIVKTATREMKTLGTLFTVQALQGLQNQKDRTGSCLTHVLQLPGSEHSRWPGYQVHNQEEAVERDSQWHWEKRRQRRESTAH